MTEPSPTQTRERRIRAALRTVELTGRVYEQASERLREAQVALDGLPPVHGVLIDYRNEAHIATCTCGWTTGWISIAGMTDDQHRAVMFDIEAAVDVHHAENPEPSL